MYTIWFCEPCHRNNLNLKKALTFQADLGRNKVERNHWHFWLSKKMGSVRGKGVAIPGERGKHKNKHKMRSRWVGTAVPWGLDCHAQAGESILNVTAHGHHWGNYRSEEMNRSQRDLESREMIRSKMPHKDTLKHHKQWVW